MIYKKTTPLSKLCLFAFCSKTISLSPYERVFWGSSIIVWFLWYFPSPRTLPSKTIQWIVLWEDWGQGWGFDIIKYSQRNSLGKFVCFYSKTLTCSFRMNFLFQVVIPSSTQKITLHRRVTKYNYFRSFTTRTKNVRLGPHKTVLLVPIVWTSPSLKICGFC